MKITIEKYANESVDVQTIERSPKDDIPPFQYGYIEDRLGAYDYYDWRWVNFEGREKEINAMNTEDRFVKVYATKIHLGVKLITKQEYNDKKLNK